MWKVGHHPCPATNNFGERRAEEIDVKTHKAESVGAEPSRPDQTRTEEKSTAVSKSESEKKSVAHTTQTT